MSSSLESESGRIFDLAPYVDRLMRSSNPYEFLIIKIVHSEDFMQLSGNPSGVQVDFPLITPRQLSFEEKIKRVAGREGLEVVETHGSDGSRFMDINLNGESRVIAAICSKVLREVYSVSGDAELLFEHTGLAPNSGMGG
jgi:hypothetical protein